MNHRHLGQGLHQHGWKRVIRHVCQPGQIGSRSVGIPDAGMRIRVGRHHLIALPARFLPAQGNVQCHDPVSRILFPGNLGMSPVGGMQATEPVTRPG